MAKSTSPRLGLTRFTADSDTWSRAEFDANNAAREALVAIATQGNGPHPEPDGHPSGGFYVDLATLGLDYFTGSDLHSIQRKTDEEVTYSLGWVADDHANTGGTRVHRRGGNAILTVSQVFYTGTMADQSPMAEVPPGYRPERPVDVELLARLNTGGAQSGRLAVLGVDGILRLRVTGTALAPASLCGTVLYPSA